MAKILCLETATTNCSVCLSENGKPLLVKEVNSEKYMHSEKLHVFIDEVMKASTLLLSELDAIAVSKGPGSYTGLRIGVSAAKGLCFALGVPLIAIPTLQVLAHQIKVGMGEVIIPLLDARRMEVYSAIFDSDGNQIRDTEAEIIDEGSFTDYANAPMVHLVGSGAEKCKGIIQLPNTAFSSNLYPSSQEMAQLAFQKFKKRSFENVAYFEPYYLKDFILGGSKQAKS